MGTLESEEQLEVAAVEVDGNTEIPTPEILQLLPFHQGDIISISDLSWLNRELEDHSWFREARLETADVIEGSEEARPGPPFKVNVGIRMIELPTRIAENLELRGNLRFRSDVLRELFGLKPGRIALEELDTKCQLMTALYKNHGYALAKVDYQFSENNLRIDINEGHLDEIRFTGNRRIRDTELIDALGFKPGDAYQRTLGELHINQMWTKLSVKNVYFKSIKNWEAKREAGRGVLAIEIEERSPFNLKPRPFIDFNRVHGLILGGRGEISTVRAGTRTFGALSYGLSSEIWNYQVGTEFSWFEHHPFSVGGNLYRLTDTNGDSGLSASEEFLAALIFGASFLDYYQREGFQAWVRQKLTPSTHLTLEFTSDGHENLFKSTDWSLFHKNDPKRSNLRINEGNLRTVSLSYNFDSRDHKSHRKRNFRTYPSLNSHTTHGWRGSFSVEYAGEQLNSDFDFTLYRFQVARYNRLSRRHFLDFRLAGGFSDAPLPWQRLFYLGGIGTLRGYDFREFVGDNMLLFNAEYRIQLSQSSDESGAEDIAGTVFFDTGYAWYDDESFALEHLNPSIGIGLAFIDGVSTVDAVRIEVARALRVGRNINFILRLARMF